jgi:CotH kinase protein
MRQLFRLVASIAALIFTVPSVEAQESGWPEVFSPFVLRTLNLTIDAGDWNTIRHDTTNEIEVPASFWADGENPILVSVRRKSSRALPSEGNPVKVGLKIDINEFVKQEWHGLVKLSLENGGDLPALEEGLAWNLHQLASIDGFYGNGYHAGLASWVRVNVNGEYIGVYTSVEQRDKRLLENRGLWLKDSTWLYEVEEANVYILEEGDPHSPVFTQLCYSPFFASSGKKAQGCQRPDDTTLEFQLDSSIEMDAMLTQAAVDAFVDNDDALFSHGKNFSLADFNHDGLKRRYYPWDLDAVFRRKDASIYGEVSRRGRVSQSPYQSVILNHPGYRARYNAILLKLTDPIVGPLSETAVHAFLDQVLVTVGQAVADEPYSLESADATIARLRGWISARIANVRTQASAVPSGPPATR